MSKHRPSGYAASSCVLIGIVGGSGSGKSWLASQLQKALGKSRVACVSLDDFYRDRSHLSMARRNQLNFDHPAAIDWAALELAANCWLSARAAPIPRYDFATHSRRKETATIPAKPFVLMEGLWLFRRRSLRSKFSVRIFIECGARCRLKRRLARDCRQRGRTMTSVRKQFHHTVEPMHKKFVEPQKHWADVVLSGDFVKRDISLLANQIRKGSASTANPVAKSLRKRM
jgi:uridine kinase